MTNEIEKKETQIVKSADMEVFGADFERSQRMAQALASSPIVPRMYQGEIGSCLIAIDMASRLRMSPIAIMQKMYIVGGKPAFEATFVISAVNTCGRFSRLQFIENGKSGDEFGVYAVSKDLFTGEVLKGTTIDMRMVNAEGWNTDKPTQGGGVQISKWNSMPEQMFKYRAASFWQREHAPELTMGIPTKEEVVDVMAAPAKVVGRTFPATLETVTQDNIEATDGEADSSVDTGEAIALAEKVWVDDHMLRLSEVCRQKGFSIMSANATEMEWLITELTDRLAAMESEVE